LALICDQWLTTYFFSNVVDVAENWLAGTGNLTIELTLDNLWMYQNVGSSTNSNLTANVSIIDDPAPNSGYTYEWKFILPDDITVEPATVSGGQASDTSCNFAAPNVNQPQGLSDSGRPLTVKVTVTGVDYPNTGSAEAQFGIALLADVNNDTSVNVADRSIINAFWRTGSAGSFTLKDCDVNSDDSVNVADRSIANAIWRGALGQNSVSNPCPLRPVVPGMAFIPGGEFEMGDHHGDGGSGELPIHAVYLDSFFMSKFEITNQQYCDYLNSAYPAQLKVVSGIVYAASDSSNSYPYCDTYSYMDEYYSQIVFSDPDFSVRTKDGRDMSDDPMVEVSWYGAAAYCNWRSSQEGYESCYDINDPNWSCDFSKNGYRLSTEAEWEYTARGGQHSPYYRFPWGDTISHSQANYKSDWSGGNPYFPYDVSPTEGTHPLWGGFGPFTSPVGFFDGTMKYKADYNWLVSDTSYQTISGANGYGLYDMAGNVWEWCNDWYDSDYYDTSPYDNPTGPASGSSRILRGGRWISGASRSRVAYRIDCYRYPFARNYGIGFRVVLDLE